MGYVLLWIETLVVSLLLAATLSACIARLGRRRVQLGLFVAFAFLSILLLAAVTAFVALMSIRRVTASYSWPLVALTLCYVIGLAWLRLRGFRRDGESGIPAAGAWPRGKLAIWLLVAATLTITTLWNLDLAARQQLTALRIEAGALAASVAPPRVPDRDNAALLYEEVFGLIGRDGGPTLPGWNKWTTFLDAERPGSDFKDPGLRRFLQQQAPALVLLHRAAAKAECNFDHDYSRPSIEMTIPELLPLRRGALLLALDARAKAADGDVHGAIQDINAMRGIAEHVNTEPLLVSTLTARDVDRYTDGTLQAVLATGQVTAQDLAALRLDGVSSYQKSLERGYRMEEAMALAVFADLGSLARMEGWRFNGAFDCFRLLHPIFLLNEDLTSYREAFHSLLTAAAKPYWKAKGDLEKLDRHLRTKAKGIVTLMLFPALSHAAEATAAGDARREVAQAAVAAYRYRLDQGHFPERLEQVVPKYLTMVPVDPFDGKPIRMKTTKDGIVLYSIGPDGVDNSGAPMDWEKRTGDISFRVVAPAEKKSPPAEPGAEGRR